MTIKLRLQKLEQQAVHTSPHNTLTLEEKRQQLWEFLNDPNSPAHLKQEIIARIERNRQEKEQQATVSHSGQGDSSGNEHQNETHQTGSHH